jgi:O-antigen ligase
VPEHLRALIVILALATTVFALARRPVCALATRAEDFVRRRNLWFGVTLLAFLAHDFWVFVLGAGFLAWLSGRREGNPLALYFLVLFAVPAIGAKIGGLGVLEHLFFLDYARLLALAILLPAYWSLRNAPDTLQFGRQLADVLLLAYLALQLALMLGSLTFTNALRHGVFYAFVDVFLPYYVASRGVRSLAAFRDAAAAFVVAALVLSAIATFEFMKHWLLYASLERALGASWPYGNYLMRGADLLRAQATAGSPIALGYAIAVASGLALYARRLVADALSWRLGTLLLLSGLIASLSRGPWVGAAVMLALFVATARGGARRVVVLAVLASAVLALATALPATRGLVDYLPFIGAVESANVSYRARLLEIAMDEILQRPFFGGFSYSAPALQELITGEGIIDIVNTYLGVGLTSGLVGLSLYVGFFAAAGTGIVKAMRGRHREPDEVYVLGQALIATLLGVLVMIFTVSSISIIPLVYWSVAGLGVAYARLAAAAAPGRAPSPAPARPNYAMRPLR